MAVLLTMCLFGMTCEFCCGDRPRYRWMPVKTNCCNLQSLGLREPKLALALSFVTWSILYCLAILPEDAFLVGGSR